MDTLLTSKQRTVRRAVRTFCERELRPIAKEIDQTARFPWEVITKMAELGYLGVQVPRQLGGAQMDALSYMVVVEEISRLCGSLGLCVSVHNSVALFPIFNFGTPEQIQRWVPEMAAGRKIGAFCLTEPNAGSDAGGIESTAVAEGDYYRVNANKVFVTNGAVADVCLIFTRTDPSAGRRGISILVAERGVSGFMVGAREDLCGMRANPVSSIRLADCLIPKANLLGREGQGLSLGMATLDVGRIGIAAQAVGIAQGALDEAIGYARQRRQFGAPLEKHQAIQMMIADMATRLDAARLLVYKAAILKDKGKPFSKAAAMAKLFASETAGEVTDLAVQIHGGYGYSRDYPVERYYRDARVTRIYEGSSEIHRMVIARSVMEEY